jgi:hypothetical protein
MDQATRDQIVNSVPNLVRVLIPNQSTISDADLVDIREAYRAGNAGPLEQALSYAGVTASRGGGSSPRGSPQGSPRGQAPPNLFANQPQQSQNLFPNLPQQSNLPAAFQSQAPLPSQFADQGPVINSTLQAPDFSGFDAGRSQSASFKPANLNYDLKTIQGGNAAVSKALLTLSMAYNQGSWTEKAQARFVEALRGSSLHDANGVNIFRSYTDNPVSVTQNVASAIMRSLTEQSGAQSVRPGTDTLSSDFLTGKVLRLTVEHKVVKGKAPLVCLAQILPADKKMFSSGSVLSVLPIIAEPNE